MPERDAGGMSEDTLIPVVWYRFQLSSARYTQQTVLISLLQLSESLSTPYPHDILLITG